MVSVTERDASAVGETVTTGSAALSALATALRCVGLAVACREATAEDVVDSSWAKRLGIPSRRPAWVLVATRS